ncbi:MAG: SCO family protein [Nitrosomonadales bacterium]|nr:SCO family protein [Nitrosomonadales bacterium]
MLRNFLLLLLLLAGCHKSAPPPLPSHAVDVSWRYEQTAAEFHLTDAGGKPRSLSDFRGKVVVLFFGYTHCPEVCPTTLADLARVMRQLGQDADKVQVLFVTLDPERDTPQVLAQFVPAFHPSFLGLYGDAQTTAQAAQAFAVSYEKHADKNGYTLDHTDSTFLIGKSGRSVLMSPYGQPAELLAEDIKLLLGSNF